MSFSFGGGPRGGEGRSAERRKKKVPQEYSTLNLSVGQTLCRNTQMCSTAMPSDQSYFCKVFSKNKQSFNITLELKIDSEIKNPAVSRHKKQQKNNQFLDS